MRCPCCNGTCHHLIRNVTNVTIDCVTIDCGPCNGTGEITRHGVIEIGPDMVNWEGDMASAPAIEKAYKLAIALRS